MKHLALVLVLVLAAAGAAVATRVAHSAAAPAGGEPVPDHGPRIKFERKSESFGTVAHGTVVRRSFAFRNEGEADLVLTAVRTSCGCTAALPSKRHLAPGESAAIDVSFDTSRKPAYKERTPYTNSVMVMTNDRLEKDAGAGVSRLTLEGEVLARFRVVPDSGAVLPTYQRGAASPAAVTVTVVPLAGGVTGGVSVASASPWLRVAPPQKVVRDGKEVTVLEIALDPGLVSVGPVDGTIVLKTNDVMQPEVAIPVRGVVLPKVQAAPPRLYVAGGAAPRPIMLSSALPIRIVAAEVVADDGQPAPIALPAELPGPAPRLSLELTPAPGVPPRAVAGEVRIFVADRDVPLVTVPFRVQDQARTRADIEAERAAGVRVSPPEVDLGDVAAGQEPETSIVVSRAGQQTLDVRDIAAEPTDLLEARLEPITGGQAARIVVHARPGHAGPIAGEVRFRPREGAPLVRVPVGGRALGLLLADPPALYVTGPDASVALRRADGKPIARVEATRETTGRFTVTCGAGAKDGKPWANVAISRRSDAPAGPFRGTAHVETDAGTLEIPVFGEN
jgi:hypothetical protein